MGIEPKTEREEILKLDSKIDRVDGKLDYVVESLERVLRAFEKLEEVRITDHEKRIIKIEKWIAEWVGAHRIIVYISLALGVIATIKAFLT